MMRKIIEKARQFLNRKQIIRQLEQENAGLKAEIERLVHHSLDIFVSSCASHSGTQTPAYEQFERVLGTRCHWCDVEEINRLKNLLGEVKGELQKVRYLNESSELFCGWTDIEEVFREFENGGKKGE